MVIGTGFGTGRGGTQMCTGKNAGMSFCQPKRDIVDTTFHASCVDGQISAKGSALPTLWEEQVRAGVKGCRNSTWADIEVGTHVCLGIINAPA